MQNRKVILIIMDGLGMSPVETGNAVLKAETPFLDTLLINYPSCLLGASGQEVGLDWGEMGNSEVGHFNLGTGRVVQQDFTRINRSISDGSFFANESLLELFNHIRKHQQRSVLHLIGLLSNGGIHAHIDHLKALLKLCQKEHISRIALHLFTDGRDTAPRIAGHLLDIISEELSGLKDAKIASLIGRFYAMDRDKHWERTKKAYNLLVLGRGRLAKDYKEALADSYKNGLSDENLEPIILDKGLTIKDNDAVIFFNFRRDRIGQISGALTDPSSKKFPREKFPRDVFSVGFTNLGQETTSKIKAAFFSPVVNNQLSEILSKNKLTHFHLAETEKYAHVTYFFNGGVEKPFPGEHRSLIPSPRVESYAQTPAMSAPKLSSYFLSYFKEQKPAFSVINFANPDMVGHTGDFRATIRAVEIVDQCLAKIITQISGFQPQVLITADHGNCEQMINPETNEIDKEHTTNPVPFVLIENTASLKNIKLSPSDRTVKAALAAGQSVGILADVTSTILDLFALSAPKEFTGVSLRNTITR